MFLSNFIFVVSHLKIHPAVHLNTSKGDIIVIKYNEKNLNINKIVIVLLLAY